MSEEENTSVWKWLAGQPYSFDLVIETPFDDTLHQKIVSSQQEQALNINSTTRSKSCKKATSKDKLEPRKRRKPKVVFGDARYKRRVRLRRRMQKEVKEHERMDSMSPNAK
jgi:hypothetical protein